MPTLLTPRRALAALLLVAGCASGGAAKDPAAGAQSAPRRNMNLLTAEDLKTAPGTANAYDLITALRPRWLQARGTDSFQKPTEIQVYLGSARMTGGLAALREIPALGIARIEWVDGITAAGRWGLDHGAGAIVVTPAAR